MRILKRVPRAVLWLFVSTDAAQANLVAKAVRTHAHRQLLIDTPIYMTIGSSLSTRLYT